MLRTSGYTLRACSTLIFVYLCHAVYNMNGVKRASLLTGAQTQTSKCAVLEAVCYTDCTEAVGDALVLCTVLDVLAGTGTVYVCYHLLALGYFYAENRCDLFCCSSAADRTAVNRCLAFNNCGCQTVTARITAAAAVCARQALLYRRNTLIDLDRKDLGCKCKDQAKDKTHDTQCQHCINNRHHLLFTPYSLTVGFTKSSCR